MLFFESQLCKSSSCCSICRSPLCDGGKFREAIVSMFEDVKDVNYKCPNSIVTRTILLHEIPDRKKARSQQNEIPFVTLYNAIIKESRYEWLVSMAAQCKDMYDNPPKGMCCKNLKAFRQRWFKKLQYYDDIVVNR